MVFTWVKTPLVLAPNQHSCNRTARHGGPPASLLCVPGAQDGTCHGFLNKCPRLIPQGNSRSEGSLKPAPIHFVRGEPQGPPPASPCRTLPVSSNTSTQFEFPIHFTTVISIPVPGKKWGGRLSTLNSALWGFRENLRRGGRRLSADLCQLQPPE